MEYIEELRNAIQRLHGVESEYVETVEVVEEFEGRTMWDGEVSVFKVTGHPQTDTAYAWIDRAGGQKRNVAVLKIAPVESPETAVKAVILAAIKRGRQG